MKKILIIDAEAEYRQQLWGKMQDFCKTRVVAGVHAATPLELADAAPDIIFVRASNAAAALLDEGTWARGNAQLVIYSGGFVADNEVYGGVRYVSSRYLMANAEYLITEPAALAT